MDVFGHAAYSERRRRVPIRKRSPLFLFSYHFMTASTLKPSYVLMLMLSADKAWVVGITKKKGPEKLLEKLCFPGGHIEPGESAEQAASREALEETGLSVPVSRWVRIRHDESPVRELVCLAAVVDDVLAARQMEEEPVWQLAVPRHLSYAALNPECYAPGFLSDLQAALAIADASVLAPA